MLSSSNSAPRDNKRCLRCSAYLTVRNPCVSSGDGCVRCGQLNVDPVTLSVTDTVLFAYDSYGSVRKCKNPVVDGVCYNSECIQCYQVVPPAMVVLDVTGLFVEFADPEPIPHNIPPLKNATVSEKIILGPRNIPYDAKWRIIDFWGVPHWTLILHPRELCSTGCIRSSVCCPPADHLPADGICRTFGCPICYEQRNVLILSEGNIKFYIDGAYTPEKMYEPGCTFEYKDLRFRITEVNDGTQGGVDNRFLCATRF